MKTYIFMGHDDILGFNILLVTNKFDETRFAELIRLHSHYYECISLSCYEDEEEIFNGVFREGKDIVFDECIYPKDMIDSTCGIDV